MQKNAFLVTRDGWIPDMILLNNDLTEGVPEILHDIKQPILPKPNQGWHKRRKFNHYQAYNRIIEDFCKTFALDPWLFTTFSKKCYNVNFKEKKGLACIATHVDEILNKIRNKYSQYDITEDPYVFIKADKGTFGMGIITVRSGKEVLEINKKTRHSINKIKGGVENLYKKEFLLL